MIDATRFESQLRIACYRSITDRLLREGLITKDEASRIRRKIFSMEEALVSPEVEERHDHRRDVTAQ